MSEINLLPKELRAAERHEQAASKVPAPAPSYTKPAQPASQLEARLQSLSHSPDSLGFWGRIKEWFMKPSNQSLPPSPGRVISSNVMPAPVSKAPAFPPPPKRPTLPPLPKKLPSAPKERENIRPEVAVAPTALADVPLGVVLDVNLLPAENRPIEVREGYTARFVLVLGLSLLVVGIGYGVLKGLTLQRERKVEALQQEAEQLAQEVDAFRPQLTVLENTSHKVQAIQQLVKARTDWNALFDRLQDLTLVSVSFTNASFTAGGDIVLGVEATSVSDLARQLKVFESAASTFSSVSLGSISLDYTTDQTTALVQSTFQLRLSPTWANAPLSSAPAS